MRAATVLWATVLATSAPAWAADRPEVRVSQALERAAPLSGQAWVEARDALLGLGREERLVLLDRAKTLTWARASWRDDVVVEIAAAHVAEPELARRVLALEGLAPAKYLARRRAVPEVGEELSKLPRVTPFLFELALKTAEVYPFAARSAYPAKLAAPEVAALRAKEVEALFGGALEAIAGSRHPAAAYLLEDVARDERASPVARRAAATALGETKAPGAETALLALARDAKAPMAVRTGAVAGLGRLRTRATLDALFELHARAESVELRRAAVTAVGTLATAGALKRQKTPGGAELKERAGEWLVETLASRRGAEVEDELVEALAKTADPKARARMGARLSEGGETDEVRARLERARRRMTER